MANTSPGHIPVLGNVHPIKIENVRVFIFLIDRVTQEVSMKNIELLGSVSIDEAWHYLRELHFYPEYIDQPGVCMQKFVMIHWILQ